MTYSASVNLNRAWLIDPLNPTTGSVHFGSRRQSDWTDAMEGEVRRLSGNVKKIVGYGTTMQAISITAVLISPADLRQLQIWKGRTLLLRTAVGERLYGSYLSLSIHDHQRTSEGLLGIAHTVQFTFNEVSYVEYV